MKAAKLTGEKLLKAAVNKIIEHPESWDQSQWHCGTSHCIFGWCQILSGNDQNSDTCFNEVSTLLGISNLEASWLSAPNRSLSQIYNFAENFNRVGYDRDGYDRDGYDSVGYDSAGYDRAGYNRAGYNRDGYNRDGYNRDGKRLELFLI